MLSVRRSIHNPPRPIIRSPSTGSRCFVYAATIVRRLDYRAPNDFADSRASWRVRINPPGYPPGLAPHPSLKPQAFLRTLVRAVLPRGEGVVLDPFAGAGSTLAAAEAVGYQSIGVEQDERYFALAKRAIPKLTSYIPNGGQSRR